MTKTSPAKFMREVRQEAVKTTWPTRKETVISSIMVIVMATVAAIFFLLVDMLIGGFVQWILGIRG